MNAERTSRIALAVSVLALVAGVIAWISVKTGKPTPPHPFQYFKLKNNSAKSVTAAEVKGRDPSGTEYSCQAWNQPLPILTGGTRAQPRPSGWPEHIRKIKLIVTLQDSDTAIDSGWVEVPAFCINYAEWDISTSNQIVTTLTVPHLELD